MALYRTIQGPPKETAFTDEQLERYLAEVRREERAGWLPLFEAVEGIERFGDYREESEDFFEYSPEYNAARNNMRRAIKAVREMLAAEQGQGEGQERKGENE